jgi:hypothetical protein
MARGHHRMRCDLDFWRNDIHARQRRLCLRDRADRQAGRVHGALYDVISALHSLLDHGLGRKSSSIGGRLSYGPAAFGSGCVSTPLLIRVPQLPQAGEDCDLPD